MLKSRACFSDRQSTNIPLPLEIDDATLRVELRALGQPNAPITKSTKQLYIKRLIKLKQEATNMQKRPEYRKEYESIPDRDLGSTIPRQFENFTLNKDSNRIQDTKPANYMPKICTNPIQLETKFSKELLNTLEFENNFLYIKDYLKYIKELMAHFKSNVNKTELRGGHLKESYIYMLIDSGISSNLPDQVENLKEFEIWKRFLASIFYVGMGKNGRPYDHLKEAKRKRHQGTTYNRNKKIERILKIWEKGNGIICLYAFHNIVPEDAYTREAAVIDALGLQHLTNEITGTYYGDVKTWNDQKKKHLGIALLFKAMYIFINEDGSQISQSDI